MLTEYLTSQGFAPEIGGGGAAFMSRYFPNGASIWITPNDGAGMPEESDWLACVYGRTADNDTTESLWSASSEDVGATTLRESMHGILTFAHGVDAALAAKAGRPPVSIDVSPVKRSGDGWTVTDDAHAVGYGVYIRNPLAHHVADFLLPDWQAASPERLAEAKRAAFAYADHLAAHLGCAVDGGERPADPVPLGDLLHGAACLWEEALRLQGVNGTADGGPEAYADHHVAEFMREWQDMGTVHMRVMVAGWAEECERDYLAAVAASKFDEPFDWEWCPRWLETKLIGRYPVPAAPAPVDLNGRRMVLGDIAGGTAPLGFPLYGEAR